MRNTGNKTPNTKPEQSEVTCEKSAKKLVQARLPFKIIGSGVLVPSSSDVTNKKVGNIEVKEDEQLDTIGKQDARKRKLSYDEEEDKKSGEQPTAESKENLSIITSKKKKTTTSEDVIVLDDSEMEAEGEKVKEVENNLKRKSVVAKSASPKTPLQGSIKRKGAGTPKSAGSASGSGRRKQSPRGSATKLKIKLPLGGKKKRRKSQRKSISGEAGSTSEESSESSDDILVISEELNPVKRKKMEAGKESEEEDVKEKEKKEDAKESTKTSDKESDDKKDTNSEKNINELNSGSKEDINKSETETEKLKENKNISENYSKNMESEDKDTNSKTCIVEKSASIAKPKDKNSTAKSTPKSTTVTISDDDETNSKQTATIGSKIAKGKKSLNTLDSFISKENLPKQEEKTNTKENEIRSPHVPKSKKIPEKMKPINSSKNLHVLSVDDDHDADDDEDAVDSSGSSVVEVSGINFKEKSNNGISKGIESPTTSKVSKLNSSINTSSTERKGGLTPKQQRLMEQRRLAREEKERRIQEQKEEKERKAQEEKLQKQREKEEKDLAKKREREEKEEQKRKEREEKDEVKRKEREEKERKRLAEIDAKNEERRKRNEVKEEEQRKKDEERRRKEQEKEEAEQKKKKAAEAFTKFFVPKSSRLSKTAETIEQDLVNEGVEGHSDGENSRTESLAFRPFQIKGDMKLAPVCRKMFNDAARERLDFFINSFTSVDKSAKNSTTALQKLYLDELKTGNITPGKWRRPTVDNKSDDDDVVIIEDELERAAQTIVEENARPVERYRVKLYKFHENRRPPYFGTWRKRTSVITARRPLAQDKKYFDYDVDSDLEWEEEEPGESLDGSDEDKEKESEDEDYEVDNEWFVPHGHLSDEELQNEDEGGMGDSNTREAQKAKLQILQQEFAQEMKKKTEKIKPRLVGCIWQDCNGNQPELCPNIIWKSFNLRAMLYTIPPVVEEPMVDTVTEANEPSSPANSTLTAGTSDKLKRIILTEEMLKNLIRLVHGNRHSKVFLIKEYIAYIEQTENAIKNGDVRGPLKSVIRDKIDEIALWQVIEPKINAKSKKKNKKKLCWLVSEDKLKQYNLESLDLHNKWSYTLRPKFVETNANDINESEQLNEDAELEDAQSRESKSITNKFKLQKMSKKKPVVITKFTKVLTTEEKAQKIQRVVADSNTPSKALTTTTEENTTPKGKSANSAATTTSKEQTTTPTIKKRVPLLMSVARGQQIPTPAKNALISQFLKRSKDAADNKATSTAAAPAKMDVEEIVILD